MAISFTGRTAPTAQQVTLALLLSTNANGHEFARNGRGENALFIHEWDIGSDAWTTLADNATWRVSADGTPFGTVTAVFSVGKDALGRTTLKFVRIAEKREVSAGGAFAAAAARAAAAKPAAKGKSAKPTAKGKSAKPAEDMPV